MNKWQIKDLKGVGDVELSLDSNQRVFTFLGTNGVGKTKTLEALSILLLGLIFPNELNKNIDEYLENVTDNDVLPFNNISFNDYYINLDILTITDNFLSNDISFNAFAFVTAKQRSSIIKPNSIIHTDIHNSDYRKSERLFWLFNGALNSTLSDVDIGDTSHSWFLARARFSNPYQIEKDNSQIAIESVLQCLHQIDNAFDDKFLQINENDNVYLKVNGEVLELGELSSGFLSLVKIIQSIIASFSAFTNEKDLLNVKGVVLIDEIESHLHLEWQVKIIPILKNLFPNTTFYITTHSPLVLSQLNEGEAYLLKRDDDNVVRSHMINSPNTRLLENVLQDAFGVNLNELKRQNMANIDQSKAKKKLLDLLNSQVS